MDNLALLSTSDLKSFLGEVIVERYAHVEVDSHTVRQILKISQSTLNRYVDNNLLKVTNRGEGDRKFNLAEILYLNKEEMKRQNRTINRTQVKTKSR
ncbi:MAG: hypothetical protein M0R37_11135 [Bacteroidales bacterium]|nr:hypothetical protein [Bacteroidales bacterium]